MRITAAFAAVGVAVAAVLLLALRFVVGQRVLDGLGLRIDGLPRRYVDYLPTGGAGRSDIRGWSLVLGAGLAAGLLLGVLFALLRRTTGAGRPRRAAALALTGLVVGALLAVLLHGSGGRFFGDSDFGWYAYAPLGRDGVFYGGGAAPWWPLVVTGAVVGLAVGAVAAGVAVWARRARSSRA